MTSEIVDLSDLSIKNSAKGKHINRCLIAPTEKILKTEECAVAND